MQSTVQSRAITYGRFLAISAAVVFLFAPTEYARAVWPLDLLIETSVAGILSGLASLLFSGIAWYMGWIGGVFDYFITNQSALLNNPAIYESWKIMRDFVNMFFILILIVMAFGTIFKTKYSWDRVLPQF